MERMTKSDIAREIAKIAIILKKDYDYTEMPEKERSKDFNKGFLKLMRKVFGEEYQIIPVKGTWRLASGFIKHNDCFVYYNTGDYWGSILGAWYEHILIRTAKSEKDYTGGPNHFTTIFGIKENVDRLLKTDAATKPGSSAILEITEATLLSIEEAEKLPLRLRKSEDAYSWWWLRSPGEYKVNAACVDSDGSIYAYGDLVSYDLGCVRPALLINIKSSDIKIGDSFKLGDKEFEIVSKHIAFCKTDIGQCEFRANWEAADANDYEASDVKKFVDEWFEKAFIS